MSGSSTGGRPPVRPWAAAAASPSRVRSRIRSRSISAAIDATMNNIFSAMLAALGRCSTGADPSQDMQVDVLGMQIVFQQHQQLFHRPSNPVRFIDHQGVAGLERVQRGTQLGPLTPSARGLHDHLATPRIGERVELHLMILGRSADPGIANPDRVAVRRDIIHEQIVSESVPEHQHDTPVTGRVPGRPSRANRERQARPE